MSVAELDSIALADRHARTHPRDKGAPPHWLRCDRVRTIDDQSFRCLGGAGHGGAHTFVDEAEHDSPEKRT